MVRAELREALANSCKVTFACQLRERLSAEQLMRTADQLGIGRRFGWIQKSRWHRLGDRSDCFEKKEAGRLFITPQRQEGGPLAQTGIGQRDVRLSPLQAASLVVTLLHEGRVIEPRLVSEILYANGQRMMALPKQYAPSHYGQISPGTAQALLRGMEAVVTDGTGSSIRDGRVGSRRQVGYGRTLRAGRARNNQWFTGYGP